MKKKHDQNNLSRWCSPVSKREPACDPIFQRKYSLSDIRHATQYLHLENTEKLNCKLFELQTHYNNSTGMTTSSMTIRIWRIFECEGLMVGWCAKRLKGPGFHLINYLTPLQLTWLRKLSKSLNIQYNRWTDKIESILRRIWLFEPLSHLSPLIKWIPFSNLVTERFLCVATIKEITWGGVWKAKIGGGLTTTYLTSTRSLRKYHYSSRGKRHLTSNT